eukprot:scaffold754_cov133-Skeletonema_dohrnii-CCMP3373.AAC.6
MEGIHPTFHLGMARYDEREFMTCWHFSEFDDVAKVSVSVGNKCPIFGTPKPGPLSTPKIQNPTNQNQSTMARSRATGRAKKQQPNKKNAKKAIVCSVCGKGDGKYKCPKCRSPFCCVQCSKDHKANHCPTTKSSDDDVSKQQSNHTAAASTTANSSSVTEPQSKYLPAAAFAQASSSSSQPNKKRMRRPNDDDDSDNDEPGWNITEEMKQMIQRSEWLRKELEDGGLRHLIEQIDAASDVEEEEDNGNNNNRRKNWGRNANKNGNTDISQRVLTLARTRHSHPKFATFMDRLLVTAGVLTDGGGGGGEANLFEGGESGRLELVTVPRRGGELVAAPAAAGDEEVESSSEEGDSDDSDSLDEDDSDESSTKE